MNPWQRNNELRASALRHGAYLPAYPTEAEMAPVIAAIRKETGCQRPAAIHAIVAAVLRPKRQAIKADPVEL